MQDISALCYVWRRNKRVALLWRNNNEYARAYAARGYAYSQLYEHQKAIDDFSKVIELEPDYAYASAARAKAYEALGESELAEKDRQKHQELTASSV